MNRRLACVGMLALYALPLAAAPTPEEQVRIDRLIETVSNMNQVQFVRNGKAYSAEHAARFLREKLKAAADRVSNARDFIDHVATRSSTTGLPYLIRFPDGKEMPCAEFLRAELARTRGY